MSPIRMPYATDHTLHNVPLLGKSEEVYMYEPKPLLLFDKLIIFYNQIVP